MPVGTPWMYTKSAKADLWQGPMFPIRTAKPSAAEPWPQPLPKVCGENGRHLRILLGDPMDQADFKRFIQQRPKKKPTPLV